MSLVDVVVAQTDPVTALGLAAICYYVRSMREELRNELRRNRERVERLENQRLETDGGGS